MAQRVLRIHLATPSVVALEDAHELLVLQSSKAFAQVEEVQQLHAQHVNLVIIMITMIAYKEMQSLS